MARTSPSVSGVGLLPLPTKLVTPGVFRATYHALDLVDGHRFFRLRGAEEGARGFGGCFVGELGSVDLHVRLICGRGGLRVLRPLLASLVFALFAHDPPLRVPTVPATARL